MGTVRTEAEIWSETRTDANRHDETTSMQNWRSDENVVILGCYWRGAKREKTRMGKARSEQAVSRYRCATKCHCEVQSEDESGSPNRRVKD